MSTFQNSLKASSSIDVKELLQIMLEKNNIHSSSIYQLIKMKDAIINRGQVENIMI